jgi:hypothetical protein
VEAGGIAFKALALEGSDGDMDTDTDKIEGSKSTFTEATTTYFSCLAAIHTSLKGQIRALETAKIISGKEYPGSSADLDKSAGPSASIGAIDIGLLRTRVDTVERDMEAEIWDRGAKLVKTYGSNNPTPSVE